MEFYKVQLFDTNGNLIFEHNVRSRSPRQAILNVLTNIYNHPDVGSVKVRKIKAKYIIQEIHDSDNPD